jgi:hypothetical protein
MTVKASTNVTGIIGSDAVWTKMNSPYSLTGPVLVNTGVTLTVEAGVTVYLNQYYIRVNGTLSARGSSTDKIHFEISNTTYYYTAGDIEFTSASTSWDEQTGSGCVIENAVVDTGLSISGCSPRICNNVINARISISGDSPVTITNNTITDRILISNQASVVISNNTIITEKDYTTTIDVTGGSAVISNNNITSHGQVGDIGIHITGENNVIVSDNIISGYRSQAILASGKATIERNTIVENYCGIMIGEGISFTTMWIGTTSEIVIRNNTIKDNTRGIYGVTPASIVVYNNIQNHTEFNVGIRQADNVTVSNNWWGTTDTQAINQTIFDFKNDFNLGTVTFTPFLTEPNPETEPRPQVIPEFSPSTVLALLLVTALVAMVFRKKMSNS